MQLIKYQTAKLSCLVGVAGLACYFMFEVDLYARLLFLPSILFCSILQIVLTGQFGTRSGPLCLQCEFHWVHSAECENPMFKAAEEIKHLACLGSNVLRGLL